MAFLDDMMAFDGFGPPPACDFVAGVPRLTGTFWSPRQRGGHALHEVSYRACFKPELPDFLIERLSEPGDTVMDPFMGRGTTVLQAVLRGRETIGNDANPLSAMLVRPRLAPPEAEEVEAWLDALGDAREAIPHADEPEGLDAFFHASTLERMRALRSALAHEAPVGAYNPSLVPDWVRMVTLNRLTGHSSGFLSGYTLPPNQAASVKAQRRINERTGKTPPERDVSAIILRKGRSLLRHGPPPPGRARLLTGPAAAMPSLVSGSVSLVVTSPPFLDVVQYVQDNWLRCWFAGIPAESLRLSVLRRTDDWTHMMHAALAETARTLRPGGYACVEVGEVRKASILMEELVLEAARGLPLVPEVVLVNGGAFSKTANCWGIDNGTRGVNTNRVVVMRRT